MNSKRLLWTLVAADVLLAFGSAGAEGFFGWTLPPALADYTRSRSGFPGAGDILPLALLAACTLCSFAAWTGLVMLWRPARRLYLVAWGIWILHVLIAGPSVRASVAAAFGVASALVGGATIGLVYFSDLARHFDSAGARQPATGAAALATDRS